MLRRAALALLVLGAHLALMAMLSRTAPTRAAPIVIQAQLIAAAKPPAPAAPALQPAAPTSAAQPPAARRPAVTPQAKPVGIHAAPTAPTQPSASATPLRAPESAVAGISGHEAGNAGEAAAQPGPEAAAPATAEFVEPRQHADPLLTPAPPYPPLSRRLGEQGRVWLDVEVRDDGRVGSVRLRHSSGFSRLDDAAIAAVRRWRYQPARRHGVAVDHWYQQALNFSLDP